jgi:hypothetical protein
MEMPKLTMTSTKEAWCWVCIAMLAFSWPARAWAEPPVAALREADMQRAERYAARAFSAYRDKDYPTAVALYLQAYDAAPSADMLFNIARIYDTGLSDRALAMRYYREYIAAPDAEPARISLASERVARLSTTGEAGAATPSAPARGQSEPDGSSAPSAHAAPPAHGVALVPAPATRELDASSFATVPGPASAAGSTGATAAPWTPLQVGAIVAGTVGLVGIGLGAGFGVAALSDASTAREDCDGNLCSSSRGVDAARAATESANIATVSFAVGGTLLAAGMVLLWLGHEDGAAHEAEASVHWSPVASNSELGVACTGRW